MNIRKFIEELVKHGKSSYNLVSGDRIESGIVVRVSKENHIVRFMKARENIGVALNKFIQTNGVDLHDPDVYIDALLRGGVLTLYKASVHESVREALLTADSLGVERVYDHESHSWFDVPKVVTASSVNRLGVRIKIRRLRSRYLKEFLLFVLFFSLYLIVSTNF